MTNGKERPFEFIDETEYEGKYLNSESAKNAVDDLLKNPKWKEFKPASSQKWKNMWILTVKKYLQRSFTER